MSAFRAKQTFKTPQAPPNHCQHIGGASPLLTVGQNQRKMQQNQNHN
jgi:hypothetical protein